MAHISMRTLSRARLYGFHDDIPMMQMN